MAISSVGTGSGLDIEGLVKKLVSAESTPATNRINKREAKYQAEISALGTFKGALSELRTASLFMSFSSTFNSKTATSSNTNLFTAEAGYSTAIASYDIKVNQLAQAHSLELATQVDKGAKFNTGTLKIAVGTGASHDVAITEEDNTLEGIAKAINKTPGVGVTATILSDGDKRQLVLKSSATGAANTIKIEVDGADEGGKESLASTFTYDGTDAGLKQVKAAQDASITIDGSSTETTSASNTFAFTSGNMAGISLEVKSVGADSAASTGKLSVGLKTESAVEAVGDFVKSFNALTSTIKSLSSYDPKTKTGGALVGDAGVRAISTELQRSLGISVGGASVFKNLSSIGIETQRDGTLKFDSKKLTNAINDDPEGVTRLFVGADAKDGAPEVEGIAKRFKGYLDKILGGGSSISSRLDSLNKNISGLANDREALDLRIGKLQTRYTRQFSAMDSLVGSLSNVSSFLTQQFDAMASLYSRKK